MNVRARNTGTFIFWVLQSQGSLGRDGQLDWCSAQTYLARMDKLDANLKSQKGMNQITYAMATTVVYHLWWARNQLIFPRKDQSSTYIIKSIKEKILQRVLYRGKHS